MGGAEPGVAKLVAFFLTASMLAEAIHSVADSGNQLLLLIGGKRARKAASAGYPFGYGRERYIYAFIVSIVLFSGAPRKRAVTLPLRLIVLNPGSARPYPWHGSSTSNPIFTVKAGQAPETFPAPARSRPRPGPGTRRPDLRAAGTPSAALRVIE